MQLLNHEEILIGQLLYKNGFVYKDEVSERIAGLITNQLKKLSTDTSGWDILYVDPADNRLWELTYPNSEMHGGGAPTLICISIDAAKQKYSIVL